MLKNFQERLIMKRRDFMRDTAIASGAASLIGFPELGVKKAYESQAAIDSLQKQGPKPVVRDKKAVCSSSHPLVTDTMINVMKEGGNAVDAGIAGSILSATVQPHLTSHTGLLTFLYWEAKTGKAHYLDSSGTLVPGLPPFRPLLYGRGRGTMASIPGFMPGVGEIHRRFGTKEWSYLVEPSIKWAEEGHVVHSFEFALLEAHLNINTYFPSARELFTPNGFTPQVGERFKNPKLAKTLRRLSKEGPEYFTKGEWASLFVQEANRLGWPIEMKHMTEIPPRWQDPLCYKHRGYEIIQLSPPDRQALFTAIILGILSNFDLKSLGHYTESAETLYLLAHSLRWAEWEMGFLNDPKIFNVPVEEWLSKDHQKMIANIIWKSRPKIDLTEHVRLISGNPAMAAVGLPTGLPIKDLPHKGSCELSIVDPEGNWVQMMTTYQGGGIPGQVIEGVTMHGTDARMDMRSDFMGWLVGGGRMRDCIGNTIVLKDGRPWLSLGTPGNVHVTIPQVLTNILDYEMDPYEASVAPRMLALRDDYVLEIESRIPGSVIKGLAKMGIQVKPLPIYDYHMGSFQICWRDQRTGLLNSSADPRRAGKAGGF
jgi:gamma-glutamyltranspeptidase/glutathione hydrolase